MTGASGLARAGLIVSGAFLISRILGYVRLVVIANTFGASADLDAFFAAFRIPDLIFQLVAAGALGSALIPVLSGLLANDESDRAWRVVSTVINLMLCGLAVLAGLLFVLAPLVMPAITPGFGPEQLDRTVGLTRIMLLSPIFLAMGAVATSVLNAGGRFAASAVAPIVYNLAIIGGRSCWHRRSASRAWRSASWSGRSATLPSSFARWPGSASATNPGSTGATPTPARRSC